MRSASSPGHCPKLPTSLTLRCSQHGPTPTRNRRGSRGHCPRDRRLNSKAANSGLRGGTPRQHFGKELNHVRTHYPSPCWRLRPRTLNGGSRPKQATTSQGRRSHAAALAVRPHSRRRATSTLTGNRPPGRTGADAAPMAPVCPPRGVRNSITPRKIRLEPL